MNVNDKMIYCDDSSIVHDSTILDIYIDSLKYFKC